MTSYSLIREEIFTPLMGTDMEATFGQWVKRRRKSHDLTQAELARRVGCSTATIEKIEAEQRRPSRQIAELLAQVLEVPPHELDNFIKIARQEHGVNYLTGISVIPEGSRVTNLPSPATPLIGRQAELAEIERLLNDPECRLLTLVGAGGIGKTRLAIQAASSQRDSFPDGVYYVQLFGVNDAEFIAPMVADALNLNLSGPASPEKQLINYLSEKDLLLVLDDFEHLLPGTDLIVDILNHACGVSMMITSREPLGVPGEWLFEVQGLPVPSIEMQEVEANSSVALFLQSARRVKLNFQAGSGDLQAIVSICQMVDGMPLGIELAAAWVRTLTCQEINREIEKNIGFLETTVRGVPERHCSLQCVFDHSWKFLTPEEKGVLMRLSVFRGGFTRAAAEKVAGASLTLLAKLVSKSLLHRTEGGRFDLHQVVRQFSSNRLEEDALYEITRNLHSDFYLSLLRESEQDLKSTLQREVIHKLKGEIDNIRAAWDWAIQSKNFTLIGRSLRCLGWFCNVIGWLQEGIDQINHLVLALEQSEIDDKRRAVLGLALEQQGLLSFRQGNFAAALAYFEKSINNLRPLGDPGLLCGSLIVCGCITHLVGDIDGASNLLQEGIEGARTVGDGWFEAYALYNLGYVTTLLGNYPEGYQQMLDGLAMWRALGDPSCIALGLNYISPIAIQLGRVEEAKSFLKESLALSAEVGDWWGYGTAYRNLGLAALAEGDLEEARELLNKGMEIFSEIVTGWDIIRSLDYLARVENASGNPSEARRIYQKALEMAIEEHTTPLAFDIIAGLAGMHAQAGEYEEAYSLSLYVLGDPSAAQETKDAARKLAVEAQSHLHGDTIMKTQERVARFSLENIVQAVLTDT